MDIDIDIDMDGTGDVDDVDAVGAYRRALHLLLEIVRTSDVAVVVPGHGRPCDARGAAVRVRADLAYLDALDRPDPVVDPRLADPWVRAEHDRQTAALLR